MNYDGIDYVDCTIKFPTGDHSNGSWRIQLKGQSEAGVKIHRVGGVEWLRHKILIFEKIRTDYYALSVLDEAQVDNLIGQSTVVATNGSSPASKKIWSSVRYKKGLLQNKNTIATCTKK